MLASHFNATSRPFWLKCLFLLSPPNPPMRSDQDPFWAAGKGFGPVRNSLRLYPQPWERGPFSFLSGGVDTLDHSLSELLRLSEPVPLPRVAEGPAQAACASAQSAGAAQSFAPPKAKGGGAWSTAEEKRQRLQALCKWSNLLRLAPKLFSERTLASLPDTGDQAVAEHLDLLFSRKSTNTLLLRVQPLMRFVLWARRACPDESPSEQLVWVHCRWLQTTAAPSSIDILVSSLHFVHGTLGLGVPVADLLSPKIRGLAHTHLRTKEPVNQAPPLSTAQVKWLEYLSGSAPDDYERLVAATLCFMVFARARRSGPGQSNSRTV